MSLSLLFANNYNELNTAAERITRRIDIGMASDLLSETYVGIEQRQSEGKIKIPEDNEGFVKLYCQWMKNYFVWPNSKFNQLYTSKESLTIDNEFNNMDRSQVYGDLNPFSETLYVRNDELITDENALNNILILSEGVNDFTKEIIEISSSLGKTKTLKYIELIEFKRTLQPHESILFELYFEKDLSTRDISKMYSDETHKLNYQSVNRMINVIKTKINTYQWKS